MEINQGKNYLVANTINNWNAMKIAILGAGVAGLACALELKKLNPQAEVSIFEKEHVPGGLMKCTLLDGNQWDNGVFVFRKDSDLHQLMPDIFQPIEDFSQEIFLNNEIQPFPFSFKHLLKGRSPLFLAAAGFDFLLCYWARLFKADRKNLENWLRFRLTKRFYHFIKIDDYIEKLQTEPSRKLSYVLGAERLTKLDRLSRWSSIWKKLKSELFSDKNSSKSANHDRIYPFQTGIGAIPERMAKLCQEAGVKIYYNCSVKNISSPTKEYRLQIANNPKLSAELYTHIVSTLPINYQQHFCGKVRQKNAALEFVDLTLAFFTLNCPKLKSQYYVLYSYEKKHRWKRMRARSMPNGKTELLVEVVHKKGQNPDTSKLLAEIKTQLTEELELFSAQLIEKETVALVKNAYPIHKIGFEKALASIRKELENNHFCLAGRQAEFIYCHSGFAFEQGRKAAQKIISEQI